jgi:hypothetical protein
MEQRLEGLMLLLPDLGAQARGMLAAAQQHIVPSSCTHHDVHASSKYCQQTTQKVQAAQSLAVLGSWQCQLSRAPGCYM